MPPDTPTDYVVGRASSGGCTDTTPLLGDMDAVREIAPLIRIVAANPAAVRVVGRPPERLLGPVNPLIVNDEALAGWVAQLVLQLELKGARS